MRKSNSLRKKKRKNPYENERKIPYEKKKKKKNAFSYENIPYVWYVEASAGHVRGENEIGDVGLELACSGLGLGFGLGSGLGLGPGSGLDWRCWT